MKLKDFEKTLLFEPDPKIDDSIVDHSLYTRHSQIPRRSHKAAES